MSRRHGRLRRRLSPALLRRSVRRARSRAAHAWTSARGAAARAVRVVREAPRRFGRALRTLFARALRPALVGVALLTLSIALGAGTFAATTLFGQYGAPRTPVSAVAWAERAPIYLAGDCARCHGNVTTAVTGSAHERVLCESCHEPKPAHPGPDPAVIERQPSAGDETCVACHALTEARPEAFSVDLERHYAGAECLRCHEPHDSRPVTPREVTHPLARLPECTVCHAPDGLKRFPSSHREEPDSACLACHRIGAGGDD